MTTMRVVSFLPAATELLFALDVDPVGVSHECDFPPAAREVPTVIETRIDADAGSGEISAQVASATDDGGIYEIDRERLAALDPDVVITQGICDVCAVDDTQLRETIRSLDIDAQIVTSDPHSLADVFADLERLGDLLDREERAGTVLDDLQARIDHVTQTTPDAGPSVAVLDWLDPVMVAGHWLPGLVDRCGAAYGLADSGERSRPREWAEIREYDPDILIAAPCGFDLAQTRENVADLTDQPGWDDLTAVTNDDVYVMDGDNYVNRPGPRLVDTLELLAGIIHGQKYVPDSAQGQFDAAVAGWSTLQRADE